MSEKEIFDDFKKRVLWFINEIEKDGNKPPSYTQPVLFNIKQFIEKMTTNNYNNNEWPWKEYNETFPTRYEIKVGGFGAYFYDNKLKRDLDLNTILRKLRQLELMEKNHGK